VAGAAGVKPLPQEQPASGEVEYLSGLLALGVEPARAEVRAAADAGPLDPSLTLAREEADRLCDPSSLTHENYWTRMPDLSVRIGVETPMPELDPEMVEWWFDWHSRRNDRYRAWHPVAHFANGRYPALGSGSKPFWGVTNFPREDVGDGPANIRIDFVSPREFGFEDDHLEDEAVATIVCGRVGDRIVEHTFMAHVFLREGHGLRLRSRFWIADRARPRLPGPLSAAAGPTESALSNRLVRKLAMPEGVGRSLLVHCSEEYGHLNRILPGLYERFADR
jgi:hypothetical protein